MNRRSRLLIIGYGNPDRQDDGIAWHVLKNLSMKLDIKIDEDIDGISESSDKQTRLLFIPQIVPELAEICINFKQVCFIDAHTGNIKDDIQLIELKAAFELSAFTHHLTPAFLMHLCNSIYGYSPQGYLLSIRGYEFGFTRTLTDKTKNLLPLATQLIMDQIIQQSIKHN